MQIDVPYGKARKSIAVPTDGLVDVLTPRPSSVIDDVEAAVVAALRSPVDSPALDEIAGESSRVVILVSDLTRSGGTEALLPICVQYLKDLGVQAGNTTVLISRGAHRKLTKAERQVFKSGELAGVTVKEHDCDDTAELSALLLTSRQTPVRVNRALKDADLVLILSPISFHYFAGFGGGRKLVLPGCADRHSIIANHRLSLADTKPVQLQAACRAGVLDGNPVHEDMCEAMLAIRGVFAVNFFCDANGDFLSVNAGEPVESHRQACHDYRDVHRVKIEELYDVIVLSAGGHPYDMNLLQSHKALRHAGGALKEGGKILFMAECPEGVGSDSLATSLATPKEKFLDTAFEKYDLNNQAAVSLHDLTSKYEIAMVSAMNVDTLLACNIKSCVNTEVFLTEAIGKTGGRVAAIPNGRSVLPVWNSGGTD